MAYLTQYTYAKLCKTLDIREEIDLEIFKEFVYDNPRLFSIFNRLERKYLFNYRQILEDAEGYLIKYYQEVPERQDTQTYVFERAGKLKYHKTLSCRLLSKDFVDFYIPPEIRALGDEVIKEYRDWFKQNNFADLYFQGELNLQQVTRAYNLKFVPKYHVAPLNEEYKLIQEIPNSNEADTDYKFDYDHFLKDIDHLVKLYDNRFHGRVNRTLAKWDHLWNKSDQEIEEAIKQIDFLSSDFYHNSGSKYLKELFKYSRELKIKLVRNLIEYFKWIYELKKKDFDNIALEKFGLECCGSCSKHEIMS